MSVNNDGDILANRNNIIHKAHRDASAGIAMAKD